MTHAFTLVIPGEPVGKGRPRLSTRNGFAMAYTPAKTAEAEKRIRTAFQGVYGNALPLAKGKAIKAKITAFYPIPKSSTKVFQHAAEEGHIFPTKKPDLDNVVKLVLDALNGLAYEDDASIVTIIATKYYSNDPRIEVELSEML